MSRGSCVVHPAREPLLVIRKWQIEACDGNVCAAALLSFFEYWHNIKLDQRLKAKQANKIATQHKDVGTQDEGLFQFHNEQELQAGIMNLYSIRTIREALPLLEDKKFVTIHKNPNPRYSFDKTRYFIFNTDAVNDAIKRLRPNMLCSEEEFPQPIGKIAGGSIDKAETAPSSGNSAVSSGKNALPSGKSTSPITETTTETTHETSEEKTTTSVPQKLSEEQPITDDLKDFVKFHQDKKFLANFKQLLDQWGKTYPSIDILQEIRKAHNWLLENPDEKRTRIGTYLGKWMRNAQKFVERKGTVGGQQSFFGGNRENPRVLKNVDPGFIKGLTDKFGND